jgi:2-dehydro-3-deoxygalactonokinase
MKKFFSCDWGTTAFRLKLIEVEGLNIIAEENNQQGIAETYQQWKLSEKNEEMRFGFYLEIIKEHIKSIEQKLNTILKDVPVVISGMASSSIGMIKLPYQQLPFCTNGSDLKVHIIEATNSFHHKVVIISGVRTDEDVMRGEETKLIGCASAISYQEDTVYIFPGTHSKHVEVKNDKAVTFETYMTGEFFELLSEKSILSVSVEQGEGLQQPDNKLSFQKGVKDSINSNLLHNCFLVRTNDLLSKFTNQQNYYYLSGLLIGTELKDPMHNRFANFIIVADALLSLYYITALDTLNLSYKNILIKTFSAHEAIIRGQYNIFQLSAICNKKSEENAQ